MNNCNQDNFCFKHKRFFFQKSTRELGTPGFPGICYFAVCGGVFCRFAYDRGLSSVIFLHFLQKYRCVPKIGFSADISIDILTDISIDISIAVSIDIFIDISIDILIDTSIDILIDISIDILIDILTDKEEGGGRSGLLLKI